MSHVYCKVATTLKDLDVCASVRGEGFERLLSSAGLSTGREIDHFDTLPTTYNFITYAKVGKPAATIRMPVENSEVADRNDTRFGLPLEDRCRIVRGPEPGTKLAELSRLCILKESRYDKHIIPVTIKTLCDVSGRLGVTHWVSLSNTHTDCMEDADLAYEVASKRGWVNPDWLIEPRGPSEPELPPRRTWYSPHQHELAKRGEYARLHLPPTALLVVKRMKAEVAGRPVFLPAFKRYALPLVMKVSTVAATLSQHVE